MSVATADRPLVSIVVPVLHDTVALTALLAQPRDPADQWVVVNGDPSDRSLDGMRTRHQDVVWLSSEPGRGRQLGAGAAAAAGEWILFLHADTRLPDDWRSEVTRVDRQASYDWGCFRLRIDTTAWQARLIEAAVRVRVRLCRLPYGDQAMFVRRVTLQQAGGVPSVPLMEDVIMARRLGRLGPPWRSRLAASTSARRWERDGWWRRSARNLWVLTQFLLGVSPERLTASYIGTRSC
jgi:rSAM/selenodomain-associated transferase 2